MANKIKINKTKQTLINQNIAQSKFGMYAQCLTGNCIKNHYSQNFNIGETNNICEVEVINLHAIDVIKDYCQLGFNAGLKDGWINPVSMCTVCEDFIGSNYPQSEGIRDDTYNIRTNYNTITKKLTQFLVHPEAATKYGPQERVGQVRSLSANKLIVATDQGVQTFDTKTNKFATLFNSKDSLFLGLPTDLKII